MIQIEREKLEQVLEALESALSDDQPYIVKCGKAITAMKEALAQPDAFEQGRQEALKLALEALENLEHSNFKRRRLDALLAIKEVLAQTIAEEHFAKFDSDIDLAVNKAMVEEDDDAQDYVRPWVGLTFEERNGIWRKEIGWGDPSHNDEDLMKAIEAKLKEKNNG